MIVRQAADYIINIIAPFKFCVILDIVWCTDTEQKKTVKYK